MKIVDHLTDAAVLAELGHRLAHRRVELGITQADMARAAGVSKSTVERIESGASAQLSNFIRVLRSLELLSGLDVLIPPDTPSPMALLKQQGKKRTRAPRRTQTPDPKAWTWGD